jgi:Fe(3+) dicitrate transport protein
MAGHIATADDVPYSTNEAIRLPSVEVGGSTNVNLALPETVDAKIMTGKKTSVADLDSLPALINNTFRQAFNTLPGLLVSESAVPTHANLNYRGIGDPHESEFLLTLRDGIPMVSDWHGYPTAYYTPPLESIAKVEFTRGGSSLLYGPQPGPVVNYVTANPPTDRPFGFSTENAVGSHGLFSTYNQIGGTTERLGYLAAFHHRQADGVRDNADYSVFNGDLKLVTGIGTDSRWTFGFYGYDSQTGEAGRLTRAQYEADRDQTVKPHDRVWLQRYAPSVTHDRHVSDDTTIIVKGWASYQDRFSRRQNTAGTSTNLDRQEFYALGADTRAIHQWEAWDNQHTLTAGFVLYAGDSPRSRENSTDLTATDGNLIFDLDRQTQYAAIFAENRFAVGKLSIVPAVRVEFIRERVEENINVSRGSVLDSEYSDVVPLGGLGLAYELPHQHTAYANISQGYRPPKYDDLVNPTATGQLPSEPNAGEILNYEIGLRGSPAEWFRYDTSVFLTDWKDFVETLDLGGGDTLRVNSGRIRYRGWEAAGEIDLLKLCEAFSDADRFGSLIVSGSISLLDAEIIDGNNEGNIPAYAPDYVIKTGVTYRRGDSLKIALLGQFVDDHYWQDSNLAGSVGTEKIPSYGVWDLIAEARVYKEVVTIFGGINNLFNHDYYSRVRSDGIEPAPERTYYAGVKVMLP